MRHWLAVCAALAMVIGGGGLAWGTDVGVVYAPPRPVAAPFAVWTGCFIGLNAGMVASRSELLETSPASSSSGAKAEQSLAGGGQIGCDYQAGPWVLGAEGMLDGTGLRGTSVQFPNVVGQAIFFKESWIAAASGRIGYTVQPSVLLYLKGGGAWTQKQGTAWTAGGGFEWKCLPNLSIFVEYRYSSFEAKNDIFATVPPLSANASLNLQTVLVGANFRFDFGPPATTRY